jgi:hypothetical protein
MFDWFRSAQLDRIERKLDLVLRRETIEMAQQEDVKTALDIIRADVAKQTTVVAGMSVYVAGIQKQLVDMANASKDTETASALMALASQIESNTKSDADAMAANLTGVTPAQAGTTTEPAPQPDTIYNSTGGVWKSGDGPQYDASGTLLPVQAEPTPAPVFPPGPAPSQS